jgi:pimeloyl-ACP methyl ester carboxylesterase
MMAAQQSHNQRALDFEPTCPGTSETAMDRRQKALLKRILSVFVPLAILLVLSFVATDLYFAYTMLHPVRQPVINTPQGYEQVLQKPIWDERTWPGAGGTTMSGWLIYQDHAAPTAILTHGYGSNREELLGTSYELWEAGYNVITYDMRGHGNSGAEKSSLGRAELADLNATIAYAKALKSSSGAPLSDGRIGLLGVDLGGFISLTAAAADPDVKAVIVDTVYPTQADYRRFLAKRIVGSTEPPNSTSLVESGLFQSMLATTLGLLSDGGPEPMPAADAIAKLDGRPLMIVVSKSSPLGQYTRIVASKAPSAKVVEFDRTHSGAALIKQNAQVYDEAVVAFFMQVPDFAPPQPASMPPVAPPTPEAPPVEAPAAEAPAQ